MRVETISAWIFLGFGLLFIGTLLGLLDSTGERGGFLAVMGAVYLVIGVVLAVVHDIWPNARERGEKRE